MCTLWHFKRIDSCRKRLSMQAWVPFQLIHKLMSRNLRRWICNHVRVWWQQQHFERRMQFNLFFIKWLCLRLLDFSTQLKNWNPAEVQSDQNHQAWKWKLGQDLFATFKFSVFTIPSAKGSVWANLFSNFFHHRHFSDSVQRGGDQLLYFTLNQSKQWNDHRVRFWFQHRRFVRPDFAQLRKNPIQKLNSNSQFSTQRRQLRPQGDSECCCLQSNREYDAGSNHSEHHLFFYWISEFQVHRGWDDSDTSNRLLLPASDFWHFWLAFRFHFSKKYEVRFWVQWDL